MVGRGKYLIVLICGAGIVIIIYGIGALIIDGLVARGKDGKVKLGDWGIGGSIGIEIGLQFMVLMVWATFCAFWALYSGVTKVENGLLVWVTAIAWCGGAVSACWVMRKHVYARRRFNLHMICAVVAFLVSALAPGLALHTFGRIAAQLVRGLGGDIPS